MNTNEISQVMDQTDKAVKKQYLHYLQPWIMPWTMLLSDVVALLFVLSISLIIANLLGKNLDFSHYYNFILFIPLFVIAYMLNGLYSRINTNPVEELKRLTLTTLYSYLFIITMTFMLSRESLLSYSRFTLIFAGLFSIFAVPIFRLLTRHFFADKRWWGTPVLILGNGTMVNQAATKIQQTPSLGLKIAGIIDDNEKKINQNLSASDVGYFSLPTDSSNIIVKRACEVIIYMPEISREKLINIIDNCTKHFEHVTIIPDLLGIASLSVTAKDIGGILTLDIKNSALSPGAQLIKRGMDLFLIFSSSFMLIPLVLITAILIKMDSHGDIFYGNKRVGKNRKVFLCWKFRSMKQNAEAVLNSYLESDPKLQEEWDKTQKLKDDPRITRLGKTLRKWSIDEFPQLWNVVKGEMSLVGPRPCFEEQLHMYGNNQHLYTSVKPGITGLWQISGRNKLTFAERVELERYYVNNWSIWLDIYILAKTVMVVLNGDGAY